MRKPDFFIVGAQRCGTTAMYEYLRQHPEIFMPDEKELFFFGTDLNFPVGVKDEARYLSLFSRGQNAKRVGEATAVYLYSKRAAAEIKAFCPSARIIIMLRNPVDQMYSLHSNHSAGGVEDIEDFEAALDAEQARKQDLRGLTIHGYPVELLFYREVAKYTEQVRRYLDVFGSENVHIIIFDDFESDTAQVYKSTLRFLDVNQEFQPEFQVINPSWGVRSKALQSLILLPPVLSIGRALLPQRLRSAAMRLIGRVEPRPPMDPDLRTRLQAEFAPEVGRLSELLGRDLTHWSKDLQ